MFSLFLIRSLFLEIIGYSRIFRLSHITIFGSNYVTKNFSHELKLITTILDSIYTQTSVLISVTRTGKKISKAQEK